LPRKLKKQLWSEQKMQLEYLRAGLSPKNKREEDIYASMEASLSKQGHGLEVQGSYDANSDNITVEKVSGQCGPLLEHCTKIHEEKHKQNKKDLEKKWGVQTMDFWGRYQSADFTWRDEYSAHGTGVKFLKDVIQELNEICCN
jgi:hypothetical protein